MEFRKATGTGADAPSQAAVDVLGWDFAFELNEVAEQQAAAGQHRHALPAHPARGAGEEGGGAGRHQVLRAGCAGGGSQHNTGASSSLKLTDFIIPPDDVPADVQRAITHWSQWIDYWAVDWDNQDDTFHNMWQTYRTRKDKSLALRRAISTWSRASTR